MALEEKTDEKTLEINADDLVDILLAFRKRDEFPGLVRILHTAVYKVVKDNPEIDVGFDTNGNFPYSEGLEEARGRLSLSGYLEIDLSKKYYPITVSPELSQDALRERFGEKYFELEGKFKKWAERFYEEAAKLERKRLSLQAS